MQQDRFVRLPARAVGGAKLSGRAAVNPALTPAEAADVALFGRLLAARLGAPDHTSDADYTYCIRDQQNGVDFRAYSAQSGPAYGGSPADCFVDLENNDNRVKPGVLDTLASFETWLGAPASTIGAQP